MNIVKLNGCIHLHDGEKFVRRSLRRIVSAVGRDNAYNSNGQPKTVNEILANLSFDKDGNLLED